MERPERSTLVALVMSFAPFIFLVMLPVSQSSPLHDWRGMLPPSQGLRRDEPSCPRSMGTKMNPPERPTRVALVMSFASVHFPFHTHGPRGREPSPGGGFPVFVPIIVLIIVCLDEDRDKDQDEDVGVSPSSSRSLF
jgi:hypothetical protein